MIKLSSMKAYFGNKKECLDMLRQFENTTDLHNSLIKLDEYLNAKKYSDLSAIVHRLKGVCGLRYKFSLLSIIGIREQRY
jgi:HPt (histidine-containing phosphotransfer) domain-containing protein